MVLCVISAFKMNINDAKTRATLLYLALFDWIMLGVIFYMFRKSDNMAGQNMFCRIWIQTQMVGLIIEPIWILSKTQMEQHFLDELIKKLHD